MKKLNNKGFSLVELIIVIAIMVILVAVLSPVFTKYVERGRKSTDIQSASEIATAVQTAMVDPFNNVTFPTGQKFDATYISTYKVDSVSSAPVVKAKDGGYAGKVFFVKVNGNKIEVLAGDDDSAPMVFPTQADPYDEANY